ncbi:MAG: PDZ domain-containing protein [Actinobacteria bacterium]|nr:PDZ domain-containing protein [Actinomycetota bacterium]
MSQAPETPATPDPGERDAAEMTPHRLWMPEPVDEPPGGPPRRPWVRAVALALIIPLLLVTGILVGRVTAPEDPEPSAPAAQEQENEAAPDVPPITSSGAEPVAEIAAALLPSVVQLETRSGLGSGVIYDTDGLILTAAHVVQGVDTVTVRMSDGSSTDGEVVGTDTNSDIAVVRVEESGLQAADLADEVDLEVGQLAVAIGSPFGLDSTVTSGVISAINRSVIRPDGTVASMIQTDASINPGNSGGALVDRAGRVIGINDAIRTESGGNQGVGFAVPIDQAAWVAEKLVAGEPVIPAFLGVSGTNDNSGNAGALITSVEPGTAADDAGIQQGDLITKIDDTTIEDMQGLAAQIRATPPGTEVTVTIIRDGEEITVTATLGDTSTSS